MARKVMAIVIAVLVVLLFTHDGVAHDPSLAETRLGEQVQLTFEPVVPVRNAHEPGRPHRHGPSVVAASHRVDSPDRILLRTPEAEQPVPLPEEPVAPAHGAVGTPDITELQTFRC
jgi:hypothetical protein